MKKSRFTETQIVGILKEAVGELLDFALKYPCYAHHKKRWFVARVAPLEVGSGIYAVISHQAVSEKNYLKLEFE